MLHLFVIFEFMLILRCANVTGLKKIQNNIGLNDYEVYLKNRFDYKNTEKGEEYKIKNDDLINSKNVAKIGNNYSVNTKFYKQFEDIKRHLIQVNPVNETWESRAYIDSETQTISIDKNKLTVDSNSLLYKTQQYKNRKNQKLDLEQLDSSKEKLNLPNLVNLHVTTKLYSTAGGQIENQSYLIYGSDKVKQVRLTDENKRSKRADITDVIPDNEAENAENLINFEDYVEAENFERDNLCDVVNPVVIYCYCNVVDINKAEEGNCWILNDTSDSEYSEIWEIFSSQTRLRHLTLHLRPDGNLSTVPTTAIRHLPDLQWFEVQYAEISEVHSFSFGNSSSLQKISLVRNSIKTLQIFAFAHLAQVKSIDLSKNSLSALRRNVFVDLPSLTHLSADQNNISVLEDFVFEHLHNLKELKLSSNKIQAIRSETFLGLTSLKILDLHKNSIELLGEKTFQLVPNLIVLNLKHNSIKYIATYAFLALKNLENLMLQDNKLLSLNVGVFNDMTALFKLDLRQNVLETITNDTIQPLFENFQKHSAQLRLSGNMFRCDSKLVWIFDVYNNSKSLSMKDDLKEVHCYLESGVLPPRLQIHDLSHDYEVTTMGIGPRIQLLKFEPAELLNLESRKPPIFTLDDCSESTVTKTSRRNSKNRISKSEKSNERRREISKATNNLVHASTAAPSNNKKSKLGTLPIHNSRPYELDSGEKSDNNASGKSPSKGFMASFNFSTLFLCVFLRAFITLKV